MTRHWILVIVVVKLVDVIKIAEFLRSGLWIDIEFGVPIKVRFRYVVVLVLQGFTIRVLHNYNNSN